MGELDGKVAIITGGARGTGATTARLFAGEGAKVVVADIRDDLGKELAGQLGDAGHFVHLDVTSEPEWQAAVAETVATFGRLDVLVNNAAILKISPIAHMSVEDFNQVVAVNQTGVFLGMKSVIDAMARDGGGSIVNISSIDGLTAFPTVAAYCSTKWAVRGLSRTAALELGSLGIRVNTVCPQHGNPQLVADALPPGMAELMENLKEQGGGSFSALGRSGELIEIAQVVLFLASDRSSFCTGADFPVDGGVSGGHNVTAMAGPGAGR